MAIGRHTAAAAAKTSVFTFKFLLVVLAALLIVAVVGIGFASAGNSALLIQGSDSDFASDVSENNAQISFNSDSEGSTTEASILATADTRDMSNGIADIEAWEEEQRQAAIRAEKEAITRAQANQAKSNANGGVGVYEVDFTIGRDAFIAEWTERINNYLAGSPLAGYGENFATAAWEYGVDPRWSPAISNTESTKGQNCFATHNAWGWKGDVVWGSWEEAIDAHVHNLSQYYGFTISLSNAAKYCPPTYEDWYSKTLSEMAKI